MSYILVKRSDLEAVCAALLGESIKFDYDDNGPSYYRCDHCYAELGEAEYDADRSKFIHNPDCPVLVAQDIRPRRAPHEYRASRGFSGSVSVRYQDSPLR